MRTWVTVVAASAIAGCGLTLDLDPPEEPMDAAGRDGGPLGMDAGRPMRDAGPARDGGARMDAGTYDAGLDADVVNPTDGSAVDAARPTDGGAMACRLLGPGCVANSECLTGQLCRRPMGDCLGPGTCVERTSVGGLSPVCGCDGTSYMSARGAAIEGTSVAYAGPCLAEAGMGDNWCLGTTAPRRESLDCRTIWAPCFDDADCSGLFPYCVAATGCLPGDEGICVGHSDSSCYRDDLCLGFMQECDGQDISATMLRGGRCTRVM